ncbi:hypothetical protein FQN55_007091 [Onygenales sp. PD_40]|nr:hypothetical protein FQN55_007091 [Onygenales sp. PD_40]
MLQTTLAEYFSLPPRKPPRTGVGIFDLPYHVRKRIYIFAGVVRRCPMNLNGPASVPGEYEETALIRSRNFYTCPSRPVCDCTKLVGSGPSSFENIEYKRVPVQLLRTSRAVYEEVSLLIYSCNEFRISRTLEGGLSALEKLRPSTLAKLRLLRITLNDSSPTRDGHPGWDPLLRDSSTKSRNHRYFMDDWRRVCGVISRYIDGSRLQLSIICDLDSYDLALEVVQPLEVLPLLAGFSVRLHPRLPVRISTSPPARLQSLADDLSMRVTGRSSNYPQPTPKFRYTDLPWELRQRVLEFTDLVAPYDLVWSPQMGLRCNYPYTWDDFEHCTTCRGVRETFHEEATIVGIFASQCASCWKFPLSLFLASRDIHKQATRIFYSSNHFKIRRVGHLFWIAIGAASFITSLPDHAIPSLRSVEFMLPPMTPFNVLDPASCKIWDEAMIRLRRLGTPSRLRITINCSHSEGGFSGTMSDETKWNLFQRLTLMIIGLRNAGLADFFVHMEWLMPGEGYLVCRREWEEKLERVVMGDSYDSVARGKKCSVEDIWAAEEDEMW